MRLIRQTVPELLTEHVSFDIKEIDRLNLNLYQPMLLTGGGMTTFFNAHRAERSHRPPSGAHEP